MIPVLCPRCEVRYYTPYGDPVVHPSSPPPTLSRTDNRTFICDQCGTDEDIDDLLGRSIRTHSQPPEES